MLTYSSDEKGCCFRSWRYGRLFGDNDKGNECKMCYDLDATEVTWNLEVKGSQEWLKITPDQVNGIMTFSVRLFYGKGEAERHRKNKYWVRSKTENMNYMPPNITNKNRDQVEGVNSPVRKEERLYFEFSVQFSCRTDLEQLEHHLLSNCALTKSSTKTEVRCLFNLVWLLIDRQLTGRIDNRCPSSVTSFRSLVGFDKEVFEEDEEDKCIEHLVDKDGCRDIASLEKEQLERVGKNCCKLNHLYWGQIFFPPKDPLNRRTQSR